jgi:2,4-dichlorophenol 6-monooxygenase
MASTRRSPASGFATVTAIGPGCPFGDPYGEWQRIRGVSDSGAVLVRPDGHVAWRADAAGEKQLQALRSAVAGLLGHDAARTSHEDRLETIAG